MAKNKAKEMTFRQRLRANAEQKLDSLVKTATILVAESVKPVSEINPANIMRLACGGRTDALRKRLVTELANEHMAELEAIHNNQQTLNLEQKEDPDAE